MTEVVLVTVRTERLPASALDGRERRPGQVAVPAEEWDRAAIPPDELARAVVRSVRLGRLWEIFDRIAGGGVALLLILAVCGCAPALLLPLAGVAVDGAVRAYQAHEARPAAAAPASAAAPAVDAFYPAAAP